VLGTWSAPVVTCAWCCCPGSLDDGPFWHEPASPADVEAKLASCYTPRDPVFLEPRFQPRTTAEATRW
jgi:hypothetical protein